MHSAAAPDANAHVTPPSEFTDAWSVRLAEDPPLSPREALQLEGSRSVLAVVAHPDDETLAMGATLACLAADGVATHVLSLSEGEAALDQLGLDEPELGKRRMAELVDACAELGADCAENRCWPDGRLSEHLDEATDEVRRVAEAVAADVVLTLWRHDPHPDHEAAATIARRAAGGRRVVEMPLWAVHWTDPATIHAELRRIAVDGAARQAKARALASYPSQTRPLRPGLYPVVPSSVVNWPHECVVLS
jgi:LmbE family N-acetylglucosaminyl deacetylase